MPESVRRRHPLRPWSRWSSPWFASFGPQPRNAAAARLRAVTQLSEVLGEPFGRPLLFQLRDDAPAALSWAALGVGPLRPRPASEVALGTGVTQPHRGFVDRLLETRRQEPLHLVATLPRGYK